MELTVAKDKKMQSTLIKIENAPTVGEYKATGVDTMKAQADFLLKDLSYIVWKDGRGQRVTKRELTKLQKTFTWATDF